MKQEQLIIAGPCAAESEVQMLACAAALEKLKVSIMRASWWKPRTKPGFEGYGIGVAPWAAQITNMGITIGTEVLMPEHVTQVMSGLKDHQGDEGRVLFWLGSRNQNHYLQRQITERLLGEAPDTVKLLIKNQPWSSFEHWVGIVAHVLAAGIGPDRLMLCHRGFAPAGLTNSEGLRNPPDFEMAMRMKEEFPGIPMILDPSHIGGTTGKVFKVVQQAIQYDFDGLMVEAHPYPSEALTDRSQQLTFTQLEQLIALIK